MSDSATSSPERDRAQLWDRMLAGELTRVYVASDRPRYALLPHTLGLEVISSSSHTFDPHTGERLTDSKIRRNAQHLSESARWITGFGWMDWDKPFIANAQIALILPSRWWGFRQRFRAANALVRDAAGSLRAHDGEEFAAGTRIDSLLDSADESQNAHTPGWYFRQVSEYLQTEYPHKTFVASSADEQHRLRHLRVPPAAKH